jgi:RNA polymerase sigma factor (sigma-70 family)
MSPPFGLNFHLQPDDERDPPRRTPADDRQAEALSAELYDHVSATQITARHALTSARSPLGGLSTLRPLRITAPAERQPWRDAPCFVQAGLWWGRRAGSGAASLDPAGRAAGFDSGLGVTAGPGGTTYGLVTATESHDQPEFEALYDRTADRLLVSLTRRTQDPDVAGELWAECWAAAFEGWPRCRANGPAEEEAWLFAIARRRLADYWRAGAIERRALERLRWTVPTASVGENRELARVAELDALRDVLADALRELPEKRRQAVGLRIVDGLSYPDIAVRLGCSEDAARAQVSRGLRGLQRHIDPLTLTRKQGVRP